MHLSLPFGKPVSSSNNFILSKPNLIQARKYLAWDYELLGKPEEALKEYTLLKKLKQDNVIVKEDAVG